MSPEATGQSLWPQKPCIPTMAGQKKHRPPCHMIWVLIKTRRLDLVISLEETLFWLTFTQANKNWHPNHNDVEQSLESELSSEWLRISWRHSEQNLAIVIVRNGALQLPCIVVLVTISPKLGCFSLFSLMKMCISYSYFGPGKHSDHLYLSNAVMKESLKKTKSHEITAML